jgi:hypothetical protein
MGIWFNPDGLYRKFGTTKTVPNTGGEYKTYGDLRELEFVITMASLTTSPVIQNDVLFYPIGMQLQEVETEVQVAAVGGTSMSVGLMSTDRTTVTGNGLSNTFFLSAVVIADQTPVGKKVTYNTPAAGNIGTGVAAVNTVPGYITALAAGTYSAGVIRVRIRYYKPSTN